MNKPHLKVSVEIVAETTPSQAARDLILKVAKKTGYLKDYLAHNLGSAYYIELPRYIDRLLESGQTKQARRELQRCFSGKGIPDEVWSRMVK